ncbi:hypothetical protein HHI36_014957 [Cryptolaemus montrouzieri]|uniref:MADF domain-containing protein n=1 Tax=Cryptolaemus montrouzieri TaxID=559131 RepID=A0ABD2N4N2_9CUCU
MPPKKRPNLTMRKGSGRNTHKFRTDELLIELVKSKPGLYNLQSPHYSDNNYKKKMWDEIEHIVELNGGAKIRWESLRAQYRKYLGKLRTKSGQGISKISKWRYYDRMQFLNDHITVDIPRISSIMDEEIGHENIGSENNENTIMKTTLLRQSNDDEEVVSVKDWSHTVYQSASTAANNLTIQTEKNKPSNVYPESAASVLMKYILENKKVERPADSIDQFFALMAAAVKQFSPIDQHIAKTQVFSLISKIEEKYLVPSDIHLTSEPIHQNHLSAGAPSDSSDLSVISQSSPRGSSFD